MLLISRNCFTFSWRIFLSYRNQSIDLLCKSMNWLLCDRDIRRERVNTDQSSTFLHTVLEKHCCFTILLLLLEGVVGVLFLGIALKVIRWKWWKLFPKIGKVKHRRVARLSGTKNVRLILNHALLHCSIRYILISTSSAFFLQRLFLQKQLYSL